MKQSIKVDPGPHNYFTQYTRIHSKLGNVLGTGVPREYPVRQEYNFITGMFKCNCITCRFKSTEL